MAVLSKIRQRSLILILVIGFCLLAFIIGDIINSGGFGVTRNVGSVNGKDIPVQDFLQKVNDVQARQQGISPTQAANAVWSQEVDNILFEERFEKAGLRVGKDHIFNVYAQDPQVAQNPQFQNALGKFDKAKFNEFLVNMKTTNPAQWQMIEKNKGLVENAAKKQLYLTMVKAAFFATDVDGKAKYAAETDKASFDYVFVPYSSINDDQVKVSDEELVAYMKKNEKKYKSEASRDLEFVLIENKPSQEDEAEMKKEINSLLLPKVEYNETTKANDTVPGFASVANNEEFVNKYSDIKYDTTYVTKKQLPVEFAEQIYNLGKGHVFGPYIDNGYYKLTKMINKKGNASAKASHILVAFKGGAAPDPSITRTKEEAKAKADDLLKQVNANPGNFAMLAMTNTDDPGSKQTGGEYDNIMPNQMVKPFNDFVFNNPVGTTGVVETDFGYHVIKVTGKNEAVQLATVAQKIEPSEATTDAIFTKASKMEMEAEEKPFADLAKSLSLTVTPANKVMANDENIQGIGSQRGIVKWAYSNDTKVGDVKKFDIPQGHVIVRLKTINEKGVLPIEEAKISVLPIVRNEKKAELIRKKMEGTSVEAVAQKTGSTVASAVDVTLANPTIANVGSEPKVVGKAFGLSAGKTSGLINGQLGVFMVRTKTIAKAPALPNYTAFTSRLNGEARQQVQGRLSNALKDNADIEDNRSEFN
ncbi:peptidylprolyl isomerase [Flavobacterium sp. AG291]|uniref:peptidylprolyl isomerase n=1 Tax=Flavobacterium sp. AG291 TaxID=2184000 RepID=UPI000E0CA533|nr:peptidylprolyl isomerase [Flavobacterium sp. AG291]RDI15863.1 peptidyl-prolyl cis-trans isomerase D [Flavobacterium sp. AG291]